MACRKACAEAWLKLLKLIDLRIYDPELETLMGIIVACQFRLASVSEQSVGKLGQCIVTDCRSRHSMQK